MCAWPTTDPSPRFGEPHRQGTSRYHDRGMLGGGPRAELDMDDAAANSDRGVAAEILRQVLRNALGRCLRPE
jgi:hypothetical protein